MGINLIREKLKIEGMTCTSCEMRMENQLKKLDGVVEAKASYVHSTAEVAYLPGAVTHEKIIQTIERLDYKVVSSASASNSASRKEEGKKEDHLSINQFIGIGMIILALSVIIKNTIGFNFIPQVTSNMGYGILFVVGLMTSLHCIAMCGGINLSQCVSYKYDEGQTDKLSKLKPSLLYNTGRIVSYTVIGGLVGALGSAVSFSGTAKGIIAILSGIFMVIMGLNMLNIFPALRKLNPRLPKIFGKKVYNQRGKKGPFYIGLLNGLMPCGPLQAMQIYALGAGSFIAGAASMFFFSLGTVPLMFGFGALSSFLSGKFTHKMMKASAVLVIVLGVVMLGRGFSLSGINFMPGVAYAQSASANMAKIEGNIQTVTTVLESGNYTPFTVQKGIPVKWTISAKKSDINGCNRTLTMPDYNISVDLKPGDNVVEFTPKKEGNIVYTCWMGMIRSNIRVVEDLSKAGDSNDTQQLTPPGGSCNTKGCCG